MRMQITFSTALVILMLTLSACGNQAMNGHNGDMASHDGNMQMGAGMNMTAPNADAPATIAQNGISLHDPWARTGTSGDNSAAYVAVKNANATDTLVAASSDVAASVELHTVISEDGVMKMRPVEGGIEIPSAGLQMLKPGGFHIMLIGLNNDLKSGDTFEVTLTFANAGDITVTIPVR